MEFGLVRESGARPARACIKGGGGPQPGPSEVQRGLLFLGQGRGDDGMCPLEVRLHLAIGERLGIVDRHPLGAGEIGRRPEAWRAAEGVVVLGRRLEGDAADGMVLGRLAAEVAKIIRGKHKPMYTPHMDTGDNVIVINASKVRVTGRKGEQKRYFHHTGYMGHERFTPFAAMLEKHPERVIEKAVYGMLPKTALGRQSLRRKLRVFATDKHSHAAQQPKVLDLNKKSETK